MVEKSIKHDSRRYKIALPGKKHPGTCLSDNYSDAEKKLHHIENRLSKKPELCKVYEETVVEYLVKGYIRQVDTRKEGNFLAYFPVIRTDQDTTKTRIVFDPSARKNGIPLNGLIHAGPDPRTTCLMS